MLSVVLLSVISGFMCERWSYGDGVRYGPSLYEFVSMMTTCHDGAMEMAFTVT
jgi:hypothetical protein